MVEYVQGQDDVLALFLYGSYGTGYQTPLSDVDLALLPLPGHRWTSGRLLELMSGLAEIGKNDDINTINLLEVPVILQMRVLDTGQLLYCRDECLLADFTESVIRRHCDFAPDLRNIFRDFDAGLREEFQ